MNEEEMDKLVARFRENVNSEIWKMLFDRTPIEDSIETTKKLIEENLSAMAVDDHKLEFLIRARDIIRQKRRECSVEILESPLTERIIGEFQSIMGSLYARSADILSN